MPSQPTADIETILERRELQTQIARLRRRLDRRVDRLVERSLLMGDWRGYVSRHPARSLLAAAGAGVLLSGLVSQDHLSSRLGRQIFDSSTGATWSQIWRTLSQACCQPTSDGNGDHQPDEELSDA